MTWVLTLRGRKEALTLTARGSGRPRGRQAGREGGRGRKGCRRRGKGNRRSEGKVDRGKLGEALTSEGGNDREKSAGKEEKKERDDR